MIPNVKDHLSFIRFRVLEKARGFIAKETDLQTQAIFEALYNDKKLSFFLQELDCTFEIPALIERRTGRALRHHDDAGVQKSLFDEQPDEDNEYEKEVALYLDRDKDVFWWYRNLVGSNDFYVQGYKRQRVFPDFVVQKGADGVAKPTAFILESKGKHLKGNLDTEYKRDLANYYTKVGQCVTWQEVGESFEENSFRFQVLDQGDYADHDWRDDLSRILKVPQGETL